MDKSSGIWSLFYYPVPSLCYNSSAKQRNTVHGSAMKEFHTEKTQIYCRRFPTELSCSAWFSRRESSISRCPVYIVRTQAVVTLLLKYWRTHWKDTSMIWHTKQKSQLLRSPWLTHPCVITPPRLQTDKTEANRKPIFFTPFLLRSWLAETSKAGEPHP